MGILTKTSTGRTKFGNFLVDKGKSIIKKIKYNLRTGNVSSSGIIANTISSALGSKKPVLTGYVGENLSPSSTTTAYQKLGINTKSGDAPAGFNPILGGGNIDYAEKVAGMTSNNTTTKDLTSSKTSKSGTTDQTSYNQLINEIANGFSDATAPSSASNISLGSKNVELPNGTYSNADLDANRANTKAEIEASQKTLDLQQKDEEKNLALTEKQQAEKNQTSVLERLFGNTEKMQDIASVREEAERNYGVYAQQAKVNAIQKELDQAIQAKNMLIGQTQNKLASLDFISNQIAQIERNSQPIIDRLSGDVKWETAVLTQNKELAAQAVTDWTNSMNIQNQMFRDFLNYNGDLISRLDKKEQDAIDRAFQLSLLNARNAHDEYMAKVEAIMDNGLSLNPRTATWDSISTAIGSTGGEYGSSIYDFSISEGLKNNATPEEVANLIRIEEDLSPKEAAIVLSRARELSATIKPQVAETVTGEVKPKTPFVGKTPARAFGQTAMGIFAPQTLVPKDIESRIDNIVQWMFKTPIE